MWLMVLLALGCTAPPPAGLPRERDNPDVILVLISGLRSEIDGDDIATKPLFDAIDRTPHAVFTDAYAQSTHAVLSMGSILTGRYVSAIPMCSTPMDTPGKAPWCTRINPSVPTLPGVLRLYGYRSLLASPRKDMLLSLSPLFDNYIGPELTVPVKGNRWLDVGIDKMLSWWAAAEGQPRLAVLFWAIPDSVVRADELPPPPGGRTIETYRETYSELIETNAQQIERALEVMAPREPKTRPWLLVVGGTNGMSLEPTGLAGKGLEGPSSEHVVDRTTRVPLNIYASGDPGSPLTSHAIVQMVDLMPTILERTQALLPAGLDGRSLAGVNQDGVGTGYSEWGDMLGLRSGRYFYLARDFHHGSSSLSPRLTEALVTGTHHHQLYDLEADPWQTTDITEARPDVAADMYQQLVRIRTGPAMPHIDIPQLSNELDQVHTSGYW